MCECVAPYGKLDLMTRDELKKEIGAVRRRLYRLRKKMEHPDYKNREEWIEPSDLTVYSVYREYLSHVIIRFISLGGEYRLGRKEKSDNAFNEKIEEIEQIIFERGAYCEFWETYCIDLSGKEVRAFFDDGRIESPLYWNDKATFLKKLYDLHIGEWKREYRSLCCDGETWQLTFYYKDDTKREYFGHLAYPYNYDKLLDLLGVE